MKSTEQDDQRRLESEKARFDKALSRSSLPKWEKSPSQIAGAIADQFYPVASLQHADLRRQITTVIESERKLVHHYATQMGRWWAENE